MFLQAVMFIALLAIVAYVTCKWYFTAGWQRVLVVALAFGCGVLVYVHREPLLQNVPDWAVFAALAVFFIFYVDLYKQVNKDVKASLSGKKHA